MPGKYAAILLSLTAIPASAAPEARLRTGLLPPVNAACISSAFGPRVLSGRPEAGGYHYGVDLPAAEGAPVFAAAAGSVIRVQHNGPGGLEMLIQHPGFVAVYSHFGAVAPEFAAGKRGVAAGEKLGVVGRTGVTFGAHLYFGIILDGKPVDPAPYLGVAYCNGQRPPAMAPPGDGGTMVGGRKYWQIPPAAQQAVR